ncbi:MAG: SDR family NAD(P)-dependent oxidoreductase [Ruminococcus sp.]
MRAVVTGATSGIGRDMAIYLAKNGWELILTGRNRKELARLKKCLPTKTEVIPLDLSEPDAPFQLYKFCQGRKIDMLVNNAGFGKYGKFADTELKDELDMISVNVRAVHILTKLFLKDFRKRNSGRILNVASSAGFLTGPNMSTYYATKNYVVRLSLAIAEELRKEKSGVTMSVLCPGPVDTNFNERAGAGFLIMGMKSSEVAEYAIEKTLKGKWLIIPGVFMKLSVFAARLLPESVMPAVISSIQKGREILN